MGSLWRNEHWENGQGRGLLGLRALRTALLATVLTGCIAGVLAS